MDLREEILGIQDCGEKTVKVPQWKNKKILVKAMTAGERYDLYAQCTPSEGEGEVDHKKFHFSMIIATAHDPATGKKLFTIADLETIMGKSPGAIDLLVSTARELSGIGEDQTEDAEKN